MQIGNRRSSGKSMKPDQHEELLYCRATMLGVDLSATKTIQLDAFNEVRRRCKGCGYPEACAMHLRRDPNNPAWETYCPNFGALIALGGEFYLY